MTLRVATYASGGAMVSGGVVHTFTYTRTDIGTFESMLYSPVTHNLNRAGPVLSFERAGPGRVFEHPPLTRLLGHVSTHGKRHSKERQKP